MQLNAGRIIFIQTHKAIIARVIDIFKCYAEIAIFILISPTGGDMIEGFRRCWTLLLGGLAVAVLFITAG